MYQLFHYIHVSFFPFLLSNRTEPNRCRSRCHHRFWIQTSHQRAWWSRSWWQGPRAGRLTREGEGPLQTTKVSSYQLVFDNVWLWIAPVNHKCYPHCYLNFLAICCREVAYDVEILRRYRKALDTSVKIATIHNVKPIRGTTVILCNLGNSMLRPCSSARGLGKPRMVSEVGVLLGLMCKYSCEECQFIVYGSGESRLVDLEKGTILHNMDSVLGLQTVG